MDKKSSIHIVMVLSWLLGYLGADRFYKGQIAWGVIKLITAGGLGVWWLVDAAYYTYQAGKAAQFE
jgi:TM2 domain-containing membrane protein YozV